MASNGIAGCPLCGAHSGEAYYKSAGRKLKRDYLHCTCCQLVWVPEHQQLSEADEKARYDQHQNSADDDGYRQHLARLSNPLLGALTATAKGLDFGSGPNPVLRAILQDGGHPTEIYDCFYAPDESALKRSYDFITATEVVEHLSAPGATLDRLWQMLNPTGILALMTQLRPDSALGFANWHYKNDPTHVGFFSTATLDHLAARWQTHYEMLDVDVAFFHHP